MKEVSKIGENCLMRSFTILQSLPDIIRLSSEGGEVVERVSQVWQRGGEHTGHLCGNLRKNDDFEDLGIN